MSTDPVTASTPPPVDVIAEALAGHQIQISTDEGDQWSPPEEDCTCSCGEEIGGWVATGADWEWPDWTKDHATHQARAVLDALTEAGGVEFTYGLQHANGYVRECRDLDEARALKDGTKVHGRRGDWANHAIVSKEKLSVTGPWTAVEG